MTDTATAFGKMFPGFDFLQGLTRNAGAALPHFNQWVAPTLNPEEIEKRIDELRTVQFWLDQNARLIGTTIQALEVQRMTLSTLKTMNVSFSDMADSLKIRMPSAKVEAPAAPAAPAWRAAAPAPASPGSDGRGAEKAVQPQHESSEGGAARPGVIDPLQWWGALTRQFTELASASLKDGSADAARDLTSTMVKRSIDAASETFKAAAAMPATLAKSATAAAARTAGPGSPIAGPAAEASGSAKPAPRRAGSSATKSAKAAGSGSAKAAARKAGKPAADTDADPDAD